MNTSAKISLTALKDEECFTSLVKRITLGEELSAEDWSFILSCSLALIDKYSETKNDGFFQFAYYLILSYSIKTHDWMPLYHLSINAGFYPISDYLYCLLEERRSISDVLISGFIDEYKESGLVLTRDQKETIDELCKSTSKYRAFIAPTSYGKSDFIRRDIELMDSCKIGIIVPSKALIWQTFNTVRGVAKKKNLRVIVHDSEYNGESSFIGVFTQERALRLIQDYSIYFDVLYIDEAHNIFEFDNRQLLLTRLIRINQKGNQNNRIIYLSPLIKDVKNLIIKNESMLIEEKRINRSIKEYRVFYRSKDGGCYLYNRFIDEKWFRGIVSDNVFSYIEREKGNKNLVYFYRPLEIESFVRRFLKTLEPLNSPSLERIVSALLKYTHKDYLMIEAIKRGVVYIHSKVPEFIKDYLYDCFKNINEIKYLASNSCVLEGVNFPIDNLFILNAYSLKGNDVINLAGRVNRLNYIFNEQGADLNKLLCNVHFVDSYEYKYDMETKLSLFRADLNDSVKNPILSAAKKDSKQEERVDQIIRTEDFYVSDGNDFVLQTLIKNSIDKKYKNWGDSLANIRSRIDKTETTNTINQTLIAIKKCFIDDMHFSDESNVLYRLKNEAAIDYYTRYIENAYHSSLKIKISYVMASFKYILEYSHVKLVFIGKSFGQVKLRESDFSPSFIDLTRMNDTSLVNYAIIKTKVEDDFIDFELMPFVKTLFDLGHITEDMYNVFAYGTTDKNLLFLHKFGFSNSLIKFIKDNDLLSEISYCGYGFKTTAKFDEKMKEQDDLMVFEINKYRID